MATITDDFTFNVAKGKVAAYFDGDITGGATYAYVVTDTGSDQTDAIRDADTLSAVFALAAQVTELPEVALQNVLVTVNDTDNSVEINCDDWSYPNATSGATTGAIIMAWKPTAGTAANTIPLLAFIYEETTTGSTLNILVPTDGFYVSEDAP